MASANQQLLDAAETGCLDAVKKALAKGAHIEATTYRKRTALIIAADQGRKDVVEYLISQGANIEAQASIGWTALMYAAHNGHNQIVKALLSHGANVNTQGNIGWTVLMRAAFNGHDQIVKALLSAGANMNTQVNSGETTLMLAAKRGYKGAVEVLITHGADISITNKNGQTALDLANEQRYHIPGCDYTAVIELLSNPPTATPTLTIEEDPPKLNPNSTEVESLTPEIASASSSSLSISFISVLQNDFKISNEKIDRPIEERDLFYLGGLFGAWTLYVGVPGLGLSDGEQHTIRTNLELIDNQQRMSAALKVWQRHNPLTATFRNLLSIVLELYDLCVAENICQYISKPSSVC